jgi:hypothetical protein
MSDNATPSQHQSRETRFLLAGVAAIVVAATVLRIIATRALGLGAITGSTLAWAIACGCFGFYVARQREQSNTGEAVLLAVPMSAIGAIAGALTGLL